MRREASSENDKSSTVTSFDLSRILIAAQDASLDILSYLGLAQGRWESVMWMTKKLVEDGQRSIEHSALMHSFATVSWPETRSRSLRDLTNSPLRIDPIRPPHKLKLSLDDLTTAPDSIDPRYKVVKRALGQLWRSLGSMILAATERGNEEGHVMSHVLEIIAYLHHTGFMPDSVYTYRPHEDRYALQQPPTLHLMSSKILTSLSDAAWRAHEASVKAAKKGAKVSYFLGHEVPGSRYRLVVTEVAPELWLELVLWSCLYGGWILDGTAILEQLAAKQRERGWGLISWREVVQAEQQDLSSASRSWEPLSVRGGASASDEDRARIRKTISSEVVTAFIDAIVNEMRVGIDSRGTAPEFLITQVKALKDFLDSNNLSLGSTAWGSILARLLESGGFVPEKRPELLLRVFELATGFGAEIGTANTSATANIDVPYFFEPTALPLNLLHRTMRAFIANGDIKGAMSTLMLLQQHTDHNKQKSVQQFFEELKDAAPRQDEPFTSHLPPVDFPAFDTNLPVSLRAKLLDLATESKIYDLGRWFLFAQDLDGPLIGQDLYSDRNVAASIVRFGTLAGENDLVLDIVKKVGIWNSKHQQHRMSAEILTALLCSQFQLHRWDTVRSMQHYVIETSTFRPRPVILSTFAAELLRMSRGPQEETMKAQEAFGELLFAWEQLILNNVRNELYCILAIMSTIDNKWKGFCSRFLAFSLRQEVKLSTLDFNQLLQGVLDGYGSYHGRIAVDTWCYRSLKTFEEYRAPGGLATMARFRVGKGEEYGDRPEDIELVQDSGAKLTVQGRVHPNRQTIWAVLRRVREEVEQGKRRGEELSPTQHVETRDTLKWAARMLHYLGSDYEDIVRDLGSLADLAELEAPVAPKHK
jgi:hypothetical protein